MITKTLSGAALAGALAAGALAVAAAQADTVVAPDTTAQNVTSYGSTSAWSRRAADGTYHLVVSQNGIPADASVPTSPVAFDPDLGPAKNGGRIVVYSRCSGTSSTAGCDIYAYDVQAQTETKIAAVSAGKTSETAPSYYKGNVAFNRAGGKKPGLYLYRVTKGLKRISSKSAAETDINETRVTSIYHPGGPSGGETFLRLSNYSGKDQRTVARAAVNGAGEGEKLLSPTLSRFNIFWLRVSPLTERTIIQAVGVNAHRGLNVLTADRSYDVELTSLSITNIPVLYTGPKGVGRIDPKLKFG